MCWHVYYRFFESLGQGGLEATSVRTKRGVVSGREGSRDEDVNEMRARAMFKHENVSSEQANEELPTSSVARKGGNNRDPEDGIAKAQRRGCDLMSSRRQMQSCVSRWK